MPIMKQILALMMIILLIMITLLISLNGCGKKEPKVTAEVVKELEDKVEEKIEKDDIITVEICYDTDNGMIRWVNGTVMGFYSNATRFEFKDYCKDKNYLIEFYCENESPHQMMFLCKSGCVNAHCI